MTIKDLERCRTIMYERENLEERIARLRSRAESTTQHLQAQPGASTADKDKLAAYAAKLDALERKLTDRMIALEDLRQRVDVWLSTLPEQQALVMRAYYVAGARDWGRVANETNFSYRHCLRIKDAALKRCHTMSH